jgi:hypothetical protein
MQLLIDDIRNIDCDAIARNPKAAKELLKCNCWKNVIFDHDLGTSENGYDLMKWMFEMNIHPEKIQLITMNPVGRDNMIAILEESGYSSKDRTTFTKEN